MKNRHRTFEDVIVEQVGISTPTKKQLADADKTHKFYMNFHDGKIHKCVTATMAMYTASILPEVSMQKALELTKTVHTLVETVLMYLVEDSLIKED